MDEFSELGADPIEPDPTDSPDIVGWLRDHPGDWEFATVSDALHADPAARRVLDEVVRRRELARDRAAARRRRWRWGAVVGGTAAVLGGATVAAVLSLGQPGHPEAGPLCRARAGLDADAVALAPGEDALTGCARVWSEGHFGTPDSVPELSACIGSGDAVEVFPGPTPGTCEQLGLTSADPELTDTNDLVVALQDRLTEEINLAECRPVSEATERAREIVAESALDGWRVVTDPASTAGVCGKAAVDAVTRTVTVHEF